MHVILGFLIMCEKAKRGVFKLKKLKILPVDNTKNCIVNSLHVHSIFIFFYNWFDLLIGLKDMSNYKSRNLTFQQLMYTGLWRRFGMRVERQARKMQQNFLYVSWLCTKDKDIFMKV